MKLRQIAGYFLITSTMIVVFEAASTQAATWTGISNTNWNNTGNWTPANVPNTATETAEFGNTGVGTVNLDLAGTTSISGVFGQTFTGIYTLDLNGNTLITPVDAATGSRFKVGRESRSGTFNIVNGTFTTQGGAWQIASADDSTSTATVNISADLGTAANNATVLQVGASYISRQATGSLSLTGTGTFRADASGIVGDGRLNIGTVQSNATTRPNATGSLTLGANLSSVFFSNSIMRIGTNHRPDGNTSFTADNNATGILTSYTPTTFGETGKAIGTLLVGHNTANNGTGVITGTLDLSNAPSVSGLLSYGGNKLVIGVGRNATGTVTLPTGTITATTASNSVFAAVIGDSDNGVSSQGGTGSLTLNGTNLVLNSISNSASDRRGLQIGVSGSLINNIANVSSGVTIDITSSPSSALNIAEFSSGGVGMTLNFADPSFTPSADNPYWGFRWRGDFATQLQTYVKEAGTLYNTGDGCIDVNTTGSALSMDGLRVATYDDGGVTYTYIGFINVIPEPGSLALAATGLFMLLPRRQRQQ